MHFETSPASSPSAPIAIGLSRSPTESILNGFLSSSPTYSKGASCAFPSWPSGPSLGAFRADAPSSYISDADLFPDELLDEDFSGPILREAPPPPREFPMPQALPVLPPLYASEKPKKRRRGSKQKPRRSSKPMTPISESPEAVPE